MATTIETSDVLMQQFRLEPSRTLRIMALIFLRFGHPLDESARIREVRVYDFYRNNMVILFLNVNV